MHNPGLLQPRYSAWVSMPQAKSEALTICDDLVRTINFRIERGTTWSPFYIPECGQCDNCPNCL